MAMIKTRTRPACLLLAAAAALSGCSYIPIVRAFFRKPYLPYLYSSEFSFEYPWRWGDGRKIAGGVEFKEPEGRALFAVVYHPKGSPKYIEPARYRQEMPDWGAVEDSHVVYDVVVSSRPAHMVQFTVYEYDPELLLGAQAKVRFTEIIMAPDPKGIYLIRYEAEKADFWKPRYRRHYEHFLKTLVLVPHEEKKALFAPPRGP